MDERGSAIMFIAVILTLGMGGFLYVLMDHPVETMGGVLEGSVKDTGVDRTIDAFRFQAWFWDNLFMLLVMIGLGVWFISSLQKARYRAM